MRNPHFKADSEDEELCHAIFATDTMGFSPEFFARTGGELYLAGLNSTTIPLPDVATQVVPSETAIGQLKACAKAMMVGVPDKDIEVLREGLVCLPHFPLSSTSNTITVLPPSNFERSAHCIANTRREAGRCQDSRRCRRRSVYCGWAWGLGDYAGAWDGAGACGDDFGEDAECEN